MAQQFKRERSAWYVMRRRCLEPTFKDFNRYGGAGITVCPAWMESFAQFLEDMGPAPTQTHWLGRLRVLENYEPGNCVWTTQPPQERRRTFCRRVSIGGEMVTAAEAARSIEVSHATVLRRVASGFPLENPPAAKLYRASKWLMHNGETLPLPQWAKRIGLPSQVLWHRIKRGWPVERALIPGRFRTNGQHATP
ncbi:MAG: hypothetical protein Q8K85_01385 [Hyphomicrobium sp.]|nr:hypothetical protein [Hyphomicrobium sp.]